ncbi:MAG: MFS transporter [Devosia sp.]|uniref:MFS transporter n=1 Tax=Devosia sp. TaxID=1871048 RepID=UPI003398ACD4
MPVESQNVSSARKTLSLLALALGTFAIGTSEFASMGIIQLFSASLGVSVTEATGAVTAYAFGVIVGAPVITLAAARVNRRTLLLALMALFVVGNILSALASGLGYFSIARFISGLPQGAYFGAGAMIASHILGASNAGKAFAVVMAGLTVSTIFGSPIATFLGQTFGWRETYLAISAIGLAALAAIFAMVPRSKALDGVSVLQELSALRRGAVWAVLASAAIGVGSIFAVYAFIGPFVTDLAQLDPSLIAVALALFGIGMTVGNSIGGRIADKDPVRGVVIGFGSALGVLAVLALGAASPVILFPGLFGVGATMMIAIPSIQVRMTRFAPEAPSLVGAMTLAALNLANAVGAEGGAAAIELGFGLSSAIWAGFALTAIGLAMFLISTMRR